MNSDDEDLKALALFLDAEIENNPTTTQTILKEGKCISLPMPIWFDGYLSATK
jgi:hypothetical protein